MSSLSPTNAYAPAFATLQKRIAACVCTPADDHDLQLADAMAVMPFVLDGIIPHYQTSEFIHHAGGADRIVATILLQTLSHHLNWPDDYRAITKRYRRALNLPQHTIELFVKETEVDAHYSP